MRLTGSRWTLPAAAFLAACGGGEPEATGTTGTTSALLNQITVGGPSTVLGDGADIASRAVNATIADLGYNRGEVEAPLKVIELSDFGCGYCRRFHQETFPGLKEQFIDTGMVEWKFMSFITGMFDHSLAVTEAAECALEQDAPTYEALGGMLWERQPEWKESSQPEALVRSWAADLGLSMEAFDACLAEDRRFQRIAGATAVAQELGVRGTPTFWIVGYGPLQGALPLDMFQGILGTLHAEVVAGAAN